jgi:hypothetical protein
MQYTNDTSDYEDNNIDENWVDPFGMPIEEDVLPRNRRLAYRDVYLNYRWCLTKASEESCLKQLEALGVGWEWRTRDDCEGVDNYTVTVERVNTSV